MLSKEEQVFRQQVAENPELFYLHKRFYELVEQATPAFEASRVKVVNYLESLLLYAETHQLPGVVEAGDRPGLAELAEKIGEILDSRTKDGESRARYLHYIRTLPVLVEQLLIPTMDRQLPLLRLAMENHKNSCEALLAQTTEFQELKQRAAGKRQKLQKVESALEIKLRETAEQEIDGKPNTKSILQIEKMRTLVEQSTQSLEKLVQRQVELEPVCLA